MDLQSFFSKTASSKGGSSINFSDSFLRFASFAENDDSIYPYWRVFREEYKFMFVDKILINTENLNSSYRVSEFGESLWRDMIDYVIDRRRFFWMYMLENSELSEAAGTSGDDFYWILKDYKDHYMPNFTIRSIALFAELQLSYEPYCRDSDGFILNVSRCKHAKNYFEFIFNKLKFQTCNSYSLSVDGILGIINPHRLDYIKQSILNKIDELTAT